MSLKEDILAALNRRKTLLNAIKGAYNQMYAPTRRYAPRGEVQSSLRAKLALPLCLHSTQLINEAMGEMGYTKVFIRGVRYYKNTNLELEGPKLTDKDEMTVSYGRED